MSLEYALGQKHPLDTRGASKIRESLRTKQLLATVGTEEAKPTSELATGDQLLTSNQLDVDANHLAEVRATLQSLTPAKLRQAKIDSGLKPDRVW
jgi:hypothetical protein